VAEGIEVDRAVPDAQRAREPPAALEVAGVDRSLEVALDGGDAEAEGLVERREGQVGTALGLVPAVVTCSPSVPAQPVPTASSSKDDVASRSRTRRNRRPSPP
jgi:hypothetical protein